MGPGGVLQMADGVATLRYEIKPGQLALAAMPAPENLPRMRAVRFRARTDHNTPVAVVLNEREGGRYSAVFWSAANVWQQIELTPADFALADGPKDPPDPDGKLDLDQVQGVAIADVGQVIAGAPVNPDFPAIIERASGMHTLAIEKFEVVEGSRPTAAAGMIDSFERPFLSWMTLGGMSIGRDGADSPLHEPAVRASYMVKDDGLAVLTRSLAALDLSGAAVLEFDIASEQEITLIVGFESKDGKRFHTTIYPPGKREIFAVKLKLADFEGAGTVDPAKLKTMSLVDVSAVQGGTAAEKNTYWIGNLRVGR